MTTKRESTLRAHRRKQLARNKAVNEASRLASEALTILGKHDMLGVAFIRNGHRVRLEIQKVAPKYVPPPRVKLDQMNLPAEMRLTYWDHASEGGTKYTRRAQGGGTWVIRHGYALTLTRVPADRPAYRVGGSFNSFFNIMRRAYEVDCAFLASKGLEPYKRPSRSR